MTESKRPRASKLRWVRIGDMRVSPKAQREFRKAHAETIASEFDLEALGYPVVSLRDDHFWILDGQHRIAALKLVGFSDDDSIECECYEGCTEADEAHRFLLRDQRRAVSKFDAFQIAVTAGWQKECHIERVVQQQGYRISRGNTPGCVGAVSALRFAYDLGSATLGRTLRILGSAYDGDRAAFGEQLIKGMALVCQRYDGSLNDEDAIHKLSGLVGGPAALGRKANALQLKTGHTKPHCVAAAIVDTLNSHRGGKKLESWWR
jgi:hypothetical protein